MQNIKEEFVIEVIEPTADGLLQYEVIEDDKILDRRAVKDLKSISTYTTQFAADVKNAQSLTAKRNDTKTAMDNAKTAMDNAQTTMNNKQQIMNEKEQEFVQEKMVCYQLKLNLQDAKKENTNYMMKMAI